MAAILPKLADIMLDDAIGNLAADSEPGLRGRSRILDVIGGRSSREAIV